MRQKFCRVCHSWHTMEDRWPVNCIGHWPSRGPRSDMAAPRLILDSMDALWHPSTGEYTDSKSHFRSITRANGGEEVGNETQSDNRKWDNCSGDDVGQAIQMLNQGYRPGEHETASEGWS